MADTCHGFRSCGWVNMSSMIFRCDSHHCNLPFAILRGRKLIIRSRHHGETHTNEIDILALIDYALSVNDRNFTILLLEKIEKTGIMIETTYSA